MKSIKVFALVLTMFILSGCGKEAEVHNPETSVASETKTEQVEETKQETEQETEVNVASESNVTAQTQEETETSIVVESETASEEEVIDPNFNGAGYKGTLQETVQSYITYEDIEPTTMYAISATSTYHDLNVTEGELVVSGLTEANQEIIVDGKGTYDNTDYYRIEFQEAMMLNHHIIIPVECLSAEKQEEPVENQQSVEQQPTTQEQPTETLPPAEPEVPEWNPDTGVSKEDWDKFFGGGATNGGHTWTPDYGSGVTFDENGNILDPNDELIDGVLEFH